MLSNITLSLIERIVSVIIPILSVIITFLSYRFSVKSHQEYSETIQYYNEQIIQINNGEQFATSNNTTHGHNSPITVYQDQNSSQYLANESIPSKRDDYVEGVAQQHYSRMKKYYWNIIIGSGVMVCILVVLFLVSELPFPFANKIISLQDKYTSLMTVLYQAFAISNIILCIGLIIKYNKINYKAHRTISLGTCFIAILISLYTIRTIHTMTAVNVIGTGLALSVISAFLVSFLVSNVHFLKSSIAYWSVALTFALCIIARLLPHLLVEIYKNK